MIIVGNCLVSEEIFEEHFVCDLGACKGACCVEGESGAPLGTEELELLESSFSAAKTLMNEAGLSAVNEKGLYQYDADGDLVTTLVGEHGACAYAIFDENGTAQCSFEKAFAAGLTQWKKPLSCHLYPIRLGRSGDYTTVNFHRWQLCEPACACGSRLKIPVYRFLRESLIRQFGEYWFSELEQAFSIWQLQQS